LRVLYSVDVLSSSGSSASPSDRKPKAVHDALLESRWPIELIAPEPVDIEDVCRVHDPDFVADVLRLRRRNGFGSVSASVARSLPYTSGACLGSALVALRDGISASLTSGFHHAGPRTGRGFCTFNGLMIASAKLLVERRLERLAIIDCDYHFGDGTQAIIDEQGLSGRLLHVSFGERFRSPCQASAYLAQIHRLFEQLAVFKPQLIFFQSGADTHVDDPLGGLLTTEQMRERDRVVFTTARELKIPLTWNLAGGYQVEHDGTIPRVVQLHLNTFEEALKVWQLI
jgi:acetoin utilization deacetylase AcuC-like enzyme